jgi:pimeloyl-ACP methyl ester carboxylesterase
MLERLDATEALANGTMRVESWAANGQRHFLVYLPGTQDWSPIAGENPLNLPSDLQAVGNGTSDSQTAVMAALRKAGARPGDEIMFVAHSQGGLVAANVAQHPAGFKVSQILAFAAPLAGIAAMKSTSVLALEHTNDPVPYLAGKANPLARNFVTVQSTAIIPGIAAHILNTYGTLASAVDHTKRPTVAAAKKRLMKRIPSGTRVKVQLIKVERKPKA